MDLAFYGPGSAQRGREPAKNGVPFLMSATAAKRDDCGPVDGFTIERKIGEGGMAVLYLAVNAAGERRVLKFPRSAPEADPVALVAFENELRLARYLEDFPYAHMPVAQQGSDGHCLVMRYIEGTDLWAYLRRNGCLSEAEAIALTKKIVRALAELHQRRIVHLDVKLSNIMITAGGEVRLIDFGLANHLDLPDFIYESFQEPKGTPAYIAPEQFYGVRNEPRSDIFSIGTILFEMTTSKLPFPEAQNVLNVISRIKRRPVSPRVYRPELSEAFAAVVMTCLENLPDRRYASMEALYEALEQLEAQAHALPAPAPRASRRWWERPDESPDHIEELEQWIAERKYCRAGTCHRIVAAVNLAPGPRAEALNRDILRQAFHMAKMQPSAITLLTVLPPQDIGLASGEKEQQMRNAAYQEARTRIRKLLEECNCADVPVGINVRTGETLERIASCVKDYEADLLIIGARTRNALSRFLLGSTAYKVLTNIKCPIYVVQERAEKAARPTVAANAGPMKPLPNVSYYSS